MVKGDAMKHHWLGLLPILSVFSGCNEEGIVGMEKCMGAETRCEDPPEPVDLPLPEYRLLSSATEDEAALAWSVELSCGSDCQGSHGQVVADAREGIWAVQARKGDAAVVYSHVRPDGEVLHVGEFAAPSGDGAYPSIALVKSVPSGGLLLSINWRAFNGKEVPSTLELVRVTGEGLIRTDMGAAPVRTYGDSSDGSAGSSIMQTTRSLRAIPAPEAPIVFITSEQNSLIRKLDAQGRTSWQQTSLPAWAQILNDAEPLESGFVLLAGPRTAGASLADLANHYRPGLVWFDAAGNPTQSTTLLPDDFTQFRVLADDSVAIAAISSFYDPENTILSSTRDLRVTRFGKELSTSGHRILTAGAVEPQLLGFTSDEDANLYVSSVGGSRAQVRGLVCKLPEHADGACFLMPEGVLPGTIAAGEADVLYMISQGELVRLELPH
jgi:hypothetical protein